jgi:hypothetical protein
LDWCRYLLEGKNVNLEAYGEGGCAIAPRVVEQLGVSRKVFSRFAEVKVSSLTGV